MQVSFQPRIPHTSHTTAMMSACKFVVLVLLSTMLSADELIQVNDISELPESEDGTLYSEVDIDELPELALISKCHSKNIFYCFARCNSMEKINIAYCIGVLMSPATDEMFLVNNVSSDTVESQMPLYPPCMNYMLKMPEE